MARADDSAQARSSQQPATKEISLAIEALERALELLERDPAPVRVSVDGLSRREIEVLELMGEGLTDVAISERLGIAPRTASRHAYNAYRKLGVTNRTAAAAALRRR